MYNPWSDIKMVYHYYSKILFWLQNCQLGPLGASFHFLHLSLFYVTNGHFNSAPLPEAV